MSEQIQKLQQEIVLLKSRILDTQDVVTQKDAELQQFASTLTEIVGALGITGGEQGVQLGTIVDEVKRLVTDRDGGDAGEE